MSLLSELSNTVIQARTVLSGSVYSNFLNGESDTYVASTSYSVAVNTGTVGAKTLQLDGIIPQGALVYGFLFDISTALTGGAGCTVAYTINGQASANILLANSPWNAGANPVQVNAALKMTASVNTLTLTIGTAGLNTGVMNIAVLYVL